MREPVRDKGRLEHMIESIDNVFAFTEGKSLDDIDNDKILFFALVKNIEIIGEAAFKLTKSFCELHPETPWESIMKMRHVLVHDYYQISSKEIWKVIKEDLEPLRSQIANYIASTGWKKWEENGEDL